jgi:hypothetical protein
VEWCAAENDYYFLHYDERVAERMKLPGTPIQGTYKFALLIALTELAIERGADDRVRRHWWGTPSAYPLLLLPFYLWGYPQIGLAVVMGYAAVSLTAVIEALREKP